VVSAAALASLSRASRCVARGGARRGPRVARFSFSAQCCGGAAEAGALSLSRLTLLHSTTVSL
jgi:hypothetical protein